MQWVSITAMALVAASLAAALQPVFLEVLVNSITSAPEQWRQAFVGPVVTIVVAEGGNSLGDIASSILQQQAAYLLSVSFTRKIPALDLEPDCRNGPIECSVAYPDDMRKCVSDSYQHGVCVCHPDHCR
ncbi:hypothetical protein BM43_3980 [Burkholderia gladioli]|uniref:Uncharacterized protein n=3 Tax=Burkholderia gladioli TaxID=28095 RepID=A0A095F3I9_BURGA|nr:hypothetical protein [Burkholderia gladioli]AJW99754.1 hypothetical protein BM43_3980 [Burkholderia gladioli]ASD79836.1 hypothetical protein CEJ98_13060 [Burkholderia gladioli pv. gladioli]AWY54920.1 hypothetical protein A8H28_28065 [Burkholderia gladioli pv. gladioli]KGC11535.1 hypothetical protein DM48_7521 [Burkholderia gladioli]PEH37929.1 hypothetical protein CRM94_26105 [Burkholderia gladioli]